MTTQNYQDGGTGDTDDLEAKQKEVLLLRQEVENLLSELIPNVRDVKSVHLLNFLMRWISNLLKNEAWSIHTRFLRAELISCRHVLACNIQRLKNDSSQKP